jgi:hypothetical protein
MKRRRAIQALLGGPALAAVPLPAPAAPPQTPPQSSNEIPKLATVATDAAADPQVRFFSQGQFNALRKLADAIVPAGEGRPSASQANVAEFLDFLIAQSPADRQKLYRDGLDKLQVESQRRFNAAFERLSADQAAAVLGPLKQDWTYQAPADSFARFLRQAKEDVIAAMLNSREFAAAQEASGRRAGGMGTYWFTVE